MLKKIGIVTCALNPVMTCRFLVRNTEFVRNSVSTLNEVQIRKFGRNNEKKYGNCTELLRNMYEIIRSVQNRYRISTELLSVTTE